MTPVEPPAMVPELSGPDAALSRHVLGHYPTGVAVITAMDGEEHDKFRATLAKPFMRTEIRKLIDTLIRRKLMEVLAKAGEREIHRGMEIQPLREAMLKAVQEKKAAA